MRIVVKVGSSTLSHKTGRMNIRRVELLCKTLADIKNAGHDIILVSSGAIAMGVGKLNLQGRPTDTPGRQAAAAVGQCELMYTYDRLFGSHHHIVGQMLITGDDLADTTRCKNFDNTLEKLLSMNVIPVINENDTVATTELVNNENSNTIGDNDTLSTIIAVHCKADLLVLLSDIDGLFTADPHKDKNATIIHEVREITSDILALAGGSAGAQGTGGMATKVNAAQIAVQNGIPMVIANGVDPSVLYDIIDGKRVGTRFIPQKEA